MERIAVHRAQRKVLYTGSDWSSAVGLDRLRNRARHHGDELHPDGIRLNEKVSGTVHPEDTDQCTSGELIKSWRSSCVTALCRGSGGTWWVEAWSGWSAPPGLR